MWRLAAAVRGVAVRRRNRAAAASTRVLVSCTADADGFVNYRRTRDALKRDIGRLGFRPPLELSFVARDLLKRQTKAGNKAYARSDLDTFLRHSTQKYDVIALMGCNMPEWILRNSPEVHRIRNHLRPGGRVLVYEQGVLVDWHKHLSRLGLHPETVKEQVQVLGNFARVFTQAEAGVWKVTSLTPNEQRAAMLRLFHAGG